EATIAAGLESVCPAETPVVFNASVPIGDFVASEFMLQRLQQAGVRPTYALVEINPAFVNQRNDWITAHIRRQLVWADLPAYFADICKAGRLDRLLSTRLNPLHCYREELCRQLHVWTARAFAGNEGEVPSADGVPWKQVLAAVNAVPMTAQAATATDTKA